MLQDMTRAFEAQRLVSLETLFALADRLEAAAAGPEAGCRANRETRDAHYRTPASAQFHHDPGTHRNVRRLLVGASY